MGGWLRWLGLGVGALVALVCLVAVAARFSDGPIGPFPGGPLVAGELVHEAVPDWTFAKDIGSIELEVDPQSPLSRTVWLAVVGGALYVPCGFPENKTWPHQALRDGRVVLRIDGRRYERQALHESDPERLRLLGAEVARKYGVGDEEAAVAGRDVWFFRMDPRPPA
jgi:hypothetical protein